jgi:branched-subunit amino acid permease
VRTGRKIFLAFLAALLGFAVGAVTASLIGTVKLMLTPGIEYSSYNAFLRAPPMIFLEALLWLSVGGAMFVLPPGFLLLVGYAMTFGPERMEPRRTGRFVFGFAAVLFALVFFFGFRSRPLDGLLLAIPMLVGVWTSLTFLNRRL